MDVYYRPLQSHSSASSPVKVIYLVGTTRCGSTLIGSLLGKVPGLVHVGEIARIWQEGFVENHRCGCGTRFDACEFWTAALGRAFGGRDAVEIEPILAALARWGRGRHTAWLATPRGRQRLRDGMSAYRDAMVPLYRAVLAEARGRIVLDTSKAPMVGWALTDCPEIDLRILHVTRDPRAVVYSWQRKKFDPAKGVDMHKDETPIPTSLRWLAFNGLAAALWDRPSAPGRYIHVRYEDLAEDPVRVVGRLLAWLAEPLDPHEIVGADHRFVSTPAHTIAGNPMRFDRGVVTIKPDTAWQREAPARDKLLVAGLTWPLLAKYRYPLLR
jgi:hypothetical protein